MDGTWVRFGGDAPDYQDVPLNDCIRRVYAAHCPGCAPLPEETDDLSCAMYEELCDGPAELTGLIATLYESAWAACELRERLKAIEDILGEDYDLEKLKELVRGKDKPDAAHQGKWISVKDKLPEESDMVLAIVNGKPHENCTLVDAYQLAMYTPEDGWIVEEYPDWGGAAVSYWMPLPEPQEVK